MVADGFSQMFALAGLMLGIPVVGSFHTDIIDLLSTHGAYAVQKLCVLTKEAVDSVVLDSCATTSTSFMVRSLHFHTRPLLLRVIVPKLSLLNRKNWPSRVCIASM